MLDIVNVLPITGIGPRGFRTVVFKPLLKKLHLDPVSLHNYQPVLNPPFFSKVIETVVYHHIKEIYPYESFQSALMSRNWSNQSAIWSSTCYIFRFHLCASITGSQCSLWQHWLLYSIRQTNFDVSGSALSWHTYLKEHSVSVLHLNSLMLNMEYLRFWFLALPLLFSLYMLSFGQIICIME